MATRRFSARLNAESVRQMKDDIVKEYKAFESKITVLLTRLAEEANLHAKVILTKHVLSGETIGSLKVVQESDTKVVLISNSKAIAFLEFGSGLGGYGHPKAAELGMGPGTYPGKGNWDNPNGWWYPTDNPALIHHTDKHGQGWAHTHGSPAYQPLYSGGGAAISKIDTIVKEVFK